jgi:hypothetical protein
MKFSSLLVLGAVSAAKVQKDSFSLFDTSLVMLEAAIPVPPPSAPINSNTLINTSSSGMNLAISNVES